MADSRLPPFSTSTATATFGARAGANAMYHACGGVLRGSVPCSAVPVLDAICTPAMAPFCCVTCSASTIKSVSVSATCPETARRCSTGAVVAMLDRSGPFRLSTRYGCIDTPLFAMVAATSAFCSGVSATSFCPMLDIPSAAASLIGPTVDSATCSGIGGGTVPRPNACAVDFNASAPVSMPSSTNAVLHDLANASRSEAVGPPPHGVPPKFSSVAVLSGSGISGRAVSAMSGVAPVCSAAAVVITLNVDPGG